MAGLSELVDWANANEGVLQALAMAAGAAALVASVLGPRLSANRRRKSAEATEDAASSDAPAGPAAADDGESTRQDRPSIAVLPFDNMSGDPEQEYFADGLTEDIITELSRFRDLFVIARNSTFTYKGRPTKVSDVGRELGVQYVVEGSVQRVDSRVRFTAQLLEVSSGAHLWAERYDRELEDIFEVQDEVASAIVAALPGRVEAAALDRSKRRAPHNASVYECVLRAKQLHHKATRDDNAEALRLLDTALEIDPDYAPAHAWKGCTLGQAIAMGRVDPGERERVREAVLQGLALDANDVDCHRVLCELYMSESRWEDAERHHDRALELNPNDARIIAQRGELRTKLGDPASGVEWIEKAMDLDPYGADSRAHLLGRALFAQRRYREAVSAYRRVPTRRPDLQAELAASLAASGQREEAAEVAAQVLGENPAFSIDAFLERRALRQPDDREHLREALHQAGFSD